MCLVTLEKDLTGIVWAVFAPRLLRSHLITCDRLEKVWRDKIKWVCEFSEISRDHGERVF
jgi:hypothetical protein